MKITLAEKLYNQLMPYTNPIFTYLNARPNLNRKLGLVFYSEKATLELIQNLFLLCNGNEKEFLILKKRVIKESETRIIIYLLIVTSCSIIYGYLQSDLLLVMLLQTFKYFFTLFFVFLLGAIKSHLNLLTVTANFNWHKMGNNNYLIEDIHNRNEYNYNEQKSKFVTFSNEKIEEIENVEVEKIFTDIKIDKKLKQKLPNKTQNFKESAKFYCIIEYYKSLYENDNDKIIFDSKNKKKTAIAIWEKYKELVTYSNVRNYLDENIKKPFNFLDFNITGNKKNSQIANIEYTSHFFALQGKFKAKEKFDRDYNVSKKKIKNTRQK